MTRLARIFAALAVPLVLLTPLFAGTAAAAPPGNQHFNRTWQRTDLPVADLLVDRTWNWGPDGRTDLMAEPYAESPGGERTVQYFDKSRMEITHPDGDADSVWYVTNGLLVVELITGQLQLGDNLFEDRVPAEVPVAGDRNDANGPTYETFGSLLDEDAKPVGDLYLERLSRSGQVTVDQSLAAQDVRSAHIDEVTGHAIAGPFWAFMNSSGLVYENGQYIEALMFQHALFGTGRPVAEAYWAEVLIAGTPTDVLMQCFERRCLTYTPDNPPGWRVEAGNVGIHYYEWRYGSDEVPAPGSSPPSEPGPGNPPPGEEPPPGDPPPGDPPPDDPPQDPPPGEDPPGEDPPQDPPPGEDPPDDEQLLPTAPTNLNAEGLLDGTVPFIALSWDDQADNEDGFRIYWYPDANNQLVAAVDPDVESYDDFSGEPGQLRCYYVEAFNAYGKSEPSNVACATVPEAPLTAPTLVSEEVDPNDPRRFTFTWNLVQGAERYVICAAEPGANCEHETGNFYKSSVLGPSVSTYPLTIPAFLAPDGQDTNLNWSAAACDMNLNCAWQYSFRSFTVQLEAELELDPPVLANAVVDPNNPARFTFNWNLVDDAERYIICVAEPGANCQNEVGAWYKSSILGPTVDSYPMDIPLWLAPDGQVTNLNWKVAACDADLNCSWGFGYQSIVVDRS